MIHSALLLLYKQADNLLIIKFQQYKIKTFAGFAVLDLRYKFQAA